MELKERRLAPGSRLVWVCPLHPEVVSDKPGECPKVHPQPQKLGFKIVSDHARLSETWACPLHPEHTAGGKLRCPECGAPMKHVESEHLLAVPFSAVIDAGLRKVVFVEKGEGVFDAVAIEVGLRAGDYYPVLRGLAAGDRVVTKGAFLLDAETQLTKSGIFYFGGSGTEPKK
jgi:hypothetical protein